MVNRREQLFVSAKFTDLTKYGLRKAIIVMDNFLYTLQFMMIYDDFLSQLPTVYM